MREALLAIKLQLDETVRQTNQMLALARTDSARASNRREAVDLSALAEAGTRAMVDGRTRRAASTWASSPPPRRCGCWRNRRC